MEVVTLATILVAFLASATKATPTYVKLAANSDPINPGPCNAQSYGKIKMVRDRNGDYRFVSCTFKKSNTGAWQFLDGGSAVGEYFDPANDCSDIVDRVPNVKNGVYWIKNEAVNTVKVWCDVRTDGGGYMLVAMKNNPVTWTVPSSNETVYPNGNPHWSSIFGSINMLDIRIQFSTSPQFKNTKADWSFRLANKRPFSKLLVRNYGGCTQHNPGIGDISYVKDHLTGKIVNTHYRCSLFSAHVSDKIGWGKMNQCLKMSCPDGYAFLGGGVKIKLDDHGSFSYSAKKYATSSGILHESTSFVGCSNGKCCACYGPKGGTKNYCLNNCQATNGGTVTKHVHVWIWIRSSVPKRAWRKCIEFTKKDSFGREQKYRTNEETGITEKGSCAFLEEVKKSGAVLLAPNERAVKKIPSAPGLLLYRPDEKKFFIQGKKQWNEIAMEKNIDNLAQELKNQISQLNKTVSYLNGKVASSLPLNADGCRGLKAKDSTLSNGIYTIAKSYKAYCDMRNGGWTLIARFSNADYKNWISNGNFWYQRISSYYFTTLTSHNRDMISEAFWKVQASEFKITRSDDFSHTALLQTTSNCLHGGTFRSKITSYGNFGNGGVWASNQCRGSCRVSYGGQYRSTAGFEKYSCSSNIQTNSYIGFWCDWDSGDGAVMMIGGGGRTCDRADHGIAITEENAAKFGGSDRHYDFGHNADNSPPTSYSLNLWVR